MSKLFQEKINKCMECDKHFNKIDYFCKKLKKRVKPMHVDPECPLPDFEEKNIDEAVETDEC